MTFRFILSLISCTLLIASCAEETPPLSFADRLTSTTWEFSLENKPPGYGDRFFFRPGVSLTTDGDTARLTNGFYHDQMKYVVRGSTHDTLGQTAIDFEETPLGGLMVSRYEKDSLVTQALFYPVTGEDTNLELEELAGKTYRIYPDNAPSERLYFGKGKWSRGSRKLDTYYYLSGPEHQDEQKTVLSASSSRYYDLSFSPVPINSSQFYMGNQESFLKNGNFSARRLADGSLEVSTVENDGKAYTVRKARMELIPSIIPDSVDLQAFTDLINYGDLYIDTSHPAPDSALVRYAYEEDFPRWGGLTLQELPYFEFNYSPLDGSFNTFVRNRKLDGGRWEFSPDRNYIIHLGEENRHQQLIPIISYDASGMELRIPLSLQTREPRGVKLLSYCKVDAFVKVQYPDFATK